MFVVAYISVLFLAEAWLEVSVIKIKHDNPPAWLNKQEHFRSAVFAALLIAAAVLYVIFVSKEYWTIPPIIVARRIWFDAGLIFMRDRPFHYEGNDWWNGKFKKVFFNNRWFELAMELAITIGCLIPII